MITTLNNCTNLYVKNLKLSIGQKNIFNNINFSLNSGDVLVINGANGSGKTSLLKVLAGITKPCSGSLYYNGKLVEINNMIWYQKNISFLTDQTFFKNNFNVIENFLYAYLYSLSKEQITKLDTNQLKLKFYFILYKYKLYEYINSSINTLSFGQVKRYSLATLDIIPTPIWYLDEPTVGLDKASISLLEKLIYLHSKRGGVVLLATHVPLKNIPNQLKLYL